ncbi:MAG: septum formation initiator family protein [Elusimicrobiota bacterium]
MKHSASKYIVLFFILALSAVLFANKTFRSLLKGKRGVEEVKAEMNELRQRRKTLQNEKELLENDMLYVEKSARKDLGFVHDGEVMYKFKYEEDKT